MNVQITPGTLSGRVAAPPSKSMAHRLIICAALAEGTSHIENIAMSEDIKATSACMRELGSCLAPEGTTLIVQYDSCEGEKNLFVNESGSTLRFLIPLCLTGEKVTFFGKPRLFERPLGVYEKICGEQNIYFEKGENSLCVKGTLCPGDFEIPGDVSSQFISGLLFALPRLGGDSSIKITGKFESKNYVYMTLYAMEKFGVKAYFEGDDLIKIPGGQCYTPCDIRVEGDWSNAAFFEALNYVGENTVTVTGLSEDTLQGDAVYKDYFEKIKAGNAVLSLADCPDLAPVLFAVASELGGAKFTHTQRLKLKESDRAAVMAEELAKFGVKLVLTDDTVTVENCTLHTPAQPLSSHNDHRIAMAMSVLAVKYGGIITDAGAVSKSMPDFYDKLQSLGAKVNLI